MEIAVSILDTMPGDDYRFWSMMARLFQASSLIQLEKYDKCEEITNYLLNKITPLYNESPDQHEWMYITVCCSKGNLCLMQRDYNSAMEYTTRAITIIEKYKEEAPNQYVMLINLYVMLISVKAEALLLSGKLSEGVVESEKAINISRSIAKHDSNLVSLFADALCKGFRAYSFAGEIDKAKNLLNEFTKWYEDMGEDKPEAFEAAYVQLLITYSIWVLYIDGKEEALRLAKKAIEIQKKSCLLKNEYNNPYLSALNNYATILLRSGELQQSLDVINDGIRIVESKSDTFPGRFDDMYYVFMETKGAILIDEEKYDEATELLEPVIRKQRNDYNNGVGLVIVPLVWTMNNLSTALLHQEKYDDCLMLVDDALELFINKEYLPDWAEINANLLITKGNALWELKQYEEAYKVIRDSISIANKKYEEQPKTFFNYSAIMYRNSLVLFNIAYALFFFQEDYTKAEQCLLDSIDLSKMLKGMNALENVETYAKATNLLGCVYQRQGKDEECIDVFEKAVELDSPEANYNLGNIYSAYPEDEDAQALTASYYMKAIELGHVYAHYSISEFIFKLSPDEELYKEIINHLEIFLESCTNDDYRKKSVYMLACSYVSLEETELDEGTLKKVFSYLEESANYGYIDIIPYYCSYLEEGIGTPVNKEEAFRWAIKGAQEDDILSQLILAEYYKEGVGTEKNKTGSVSISAIESVKPVGLFSVFIHPSP